MKAFLIVAIVVCALNVVVLVGVLVVSDYPRTQKISVGNDCVRLIMNLMWVFWSAFLLSRME